MSLRTVFRRSAAPVVAALALSALAAVPAEAAVGTPGKPTVTQTTVNSPGFVVSYGKVSGATGYKIQWSTSSKFSGAKSLVTTATKKTITGLTQGKLYYVRVAAKKGSTYGKYSKAASRTRAKNWVAKTWNVTPTVDPYSNRIVVRWKRPSSATTDSLAYRITVADNRDMNKTDALAPRTVYYRQITTAKTTATSLSQTISTGLPASATGIGTQFFFNFEVKNYDGAWKPATNISKASTRYSNGLQPADPEVDAVVSTATCDGFVARWDFGKAPLNARGLQVKYWPTADPSASVTKTGYANNPAESITISGLDAETDYTYVARAISGAQRSDAWTGEDTVKTLKCSSVGDVRIGSYNVVTDNLPTSYIAAWSSRKTAVRDNIADNADLVGVQEARSVSSQLSDLTPAGWDRADTGTGGTHLVYRTDLLDELATDKLSTSAPSVAKPAVDNAVGAVFGLDADPDTKFIAINLHANATNTSSGWADEINEVWTTLVPQLKSDAGLLTDVPVVFVGDMNLARSEFRDTESRAALGANLADAQYWQPGRTLTHYNSTNKLKQCGHAAELGIDVDGIFSAYGAAATSWDMVGINTNDCLAAAPPSDHNMIVATFEFPDTTP